MKTETEIAKKLIENIGCDVDIHREQGIHKQTCKRWLEWLENFYRNCKEEETIFEIHDERDIEEKIQDLKTAIKLYEKEGI